MAFNKPLPSWVSLSLTSVQALELLGRHAPLSYVTLSLSCAWQALRQLSHMLVFGRVVDGYIARTAGAQHNAAEAAVSFHLLQQILSRDPNPSTSDEADSIPATHAALSAVNLGESAGSALEVDELLRIYLAAAIHMERLDSLVTSLLASYFLMRARGVLAACSARERIHGWVFTPPGRAFFKAGAWSKVRFTLNDGAKLEPGSIEHLSHAFRSSRLETAMADFNAGGDIPRTQERLQELRQMAIAAFVRVPAVTPH